MEKTSYYIKEDNSAVQDYYAGIIGKALEVNGYSECITISVTEALNLPKDSTLVCISHYLVSKLAAKGFKNLIYWVQGSSPDESYMRNHSRLRWAVISAIEWYALRKAKFVFMVSEGMLKHFCSKYHSDFSGKTYLMPCYNSELNEDLFFTSEKYERNIFCYVGGLSVWQCFDETADLYKKIEEQVPGCEFRVFTGDQEKAKQILSAKGVKHFSVKYIKPENLVAELAPCKYGFIVRAASPVNYVATPTKLSNYMAAGLIPIVSNVVSFFGEILGGAEYAAVLNGNGDEEKIISLTQKPIVAEKVLEEYRKLFDRYYNTSKHISAIAERLKGII